MNNLLNKISHLSAGIIWITKDLNPSSNPNYAKIDYLLNGLLTSSLKTNPNLQTGVLFSKNYDENFSVFFFQEFDEQKYLSYIELVAKDLINQKHILVIDENKFLSKLIEFTPKELRSALHLFQ